MPFIEKDLLIGRVQYLEKINSKPGHTAVNQDIIDKVVDLIKDGELITFMQVEAVFNHLLEMANNDPEKIEETAQDILNF
jgi:DNA-directed RNA polymerase subunit F